ncbi:MULTISPECIES: DUF2516 family protein [Actinomycetaceae]|uniref:DUF2516 family protein n=1 Tax=Actinotignum timonense TaxID=1870995 RepID=A0AAW9HBS5_9ACTO|nr:MULTISPECIES: DUF2516 family protein [Actinotignum]MDE1537287.1 DUF2516 family protein [Actinotignum schaalii]MDE1654164.1 DUF2516 family protein [Actinotignum schaalii]MDK6907000.1 DUF2516 family protein [Actinotignum timonense]MDK7197524.1 DUF2516 family protein [Actinotignum sanguinis]MDK7272165.1 DUF2516 family protein [Actinotignum schaalii]
MNLTTLRLVTDICNGIFFVIQLAILAFMVWALVACLRRPDADFRYARKDKKFWSGVLLGCALVTGIVLFTPIRLPFQPFLMLGAAYGALYYLGPEEQRMGPRRSSRGRGKGSW